MSGKVSKAQVPIMPRASLPQDVQRAIIDLKNQVSSGRGNRIPQGTVFGNSNPPGDGAPLPNLSNGCTYVEHQVGMAHPGDAQPRGVRRLVAEVVESSRQIREIYFTDDHYTKGSFRRIV